jgi:hypothetical protein
LVVKELDPLVLVVKGLAFLVLDPLGQLV